MRTFIALELPDAFAAEVAAVARILGEVVGGRTMKPETFHITLAFLGDIPDADVRSAMDALDAACLRAHAVSLRADGLGKFGRSSDATLWMGLRPAAELVGLAQVVREELAARDIAYDDKPFKPHITLVRRARIPETTLPDLPFPSDAVARRVVLFKSALSQDGATYTPLYEFDLRA